MKTAIVTGATSYLGIELVRRLKRDGAQVHAIQRASSDVSRLIRAVPDIDIQIYDGTLNSLQRIMDAVQADEIYHLAGKYVRDEKPEDVPELIAANITFGSHLLEAARDNSVQRFINTGSYFQYSNEASSPVNFYAVTKNSFADILAYYASLGLFKVTSLIIYDVFGPTDWRHKLIPAIAAAQKNGVDLPLAPDELPMFPVYIDDVMDCYLQAAQMLSDDSESVHNKCFAVRGDKSCTIGEIIECFEAVGEKSILVKPGKWPKPRVEIERIWEGSILPGWKTQYSLADGIRLCIE